MMLSCLTAPAHGLIAPALSLIAPVPSAAAFDSLTDSLTAGLLLLFQ